MQTLRADDPALTQLLQAARNVELFKGFSENAMFPRSFIMPPWFSMSRMRQIGENDPADSFLMILSGELGILGQTNWARKGQKLSGSNPLPPWGM